MKPNHYLVAAMLSLSCASLGAQSAPAARPVQPGSTAEADNRPQVLEAFTVTGTNIRRVDEEKTLPITLLEVEDLELRAAPTAAELFDYLSNGGPIALDEGNVLGADARGDNNNLNLRNIGSGNTLVLLNGRRMAPHPVSMAESGVPSLAVNVNQLPAGAIRRVEILRDGASAIYGSDAAAGVVNSILRRDYTGLELSTRGALTQHGGANEYSFGIGGGKNFNAGKTNLMGMVSFFHRDILRADQRTFSKDGDIRRLARKPPTPWDGLPVNTTPTTVVRDNDFDNRSTSSNYGNFIRGAFSPAGVFVGARPDGNRGISTSTTPSTTATMSAAGDFFLTPLAAGGTGFRQTTPSRNFDSVERDYYYNLSQDRILLPKTERANLFAAIDHEVTDRLSLFGELAYYRGESFTMRDPAGIDGIDDLNITVGIDNPYNPFGSRFYHSTGAANADGTPRILGAPAAVMIAPSTGVRPREFKDKEVSVLSQSVRGVAGVRGKVFRGFDWESAVMYSRAWVRDQEDWNIRDSKLRQALARSDATAFNPFGYTFRNAGGNIVIDQPYTNPDAVMAPMYDFFLRKSWTELATWDAKISGPVYEFWGGPIGAAIGTEYRFETYKDWRPPYHGLNPASDTSTAFLPRGNDNDYIGLSPNLNLYSERNIISGYAEVFVPFVGKKNRRGGAYALELTAAGRYERFSTAGSTTKPKVGLAYRPISWLLARGSYNESFRAPNLVQTNTSPLQRSVSDISDPYRFEVTSLITDGSTSRTVFRQGNDQLKPEEASTITAGMAIEVPFLKGLTITADFWRINQLRVISNLTASGQLLRDESMLDAYTQAQLAAGRAIAQIDTASGSENYVGNSKITRAPVTAADTAAYAAFNASRPAGQQRAAVGRVLSVIDDYLNVAGRDIDGLDFAIAYRLPKLPFGQFTVRAEATHVMRFKELPEDGAPLETTLGENGNVKWRGNASVSWRHGKWGAGWFTNYYGSFMDTGAASTLAVYNALNRPDYIEIFNDVGNVQRYRYVVKKAINHNAYVSYRFGRDAKLLSNVSARFGVNNVLDTEPPLADETFGYQGGTVNARGRMFYLELSKKL
jgi:iron complex outermembrane receptor protein